jgi:hypothetical protein
MMKRYTCCVDVVVCRLVYKSCEKTYHETGSQTYSTTKYKTPGSNPDHLSSHIPDMIKTDQKDSWSGVASVIKNHLLPLHDQQRDLS